MSLVYYEVLLAIIGCSIIAEKNPKAYLSRRGAFGIRPDPGMVLILSVALMLVSGLRYRVGTDFFAYYYWKATDWSSVWRNLFSFNEGGFTLLIGLSRMIWNDSQSLILLSAIITVGLYCWTIYHRSSTYLLSMLLYLMLGQWQGSFNGIRQYLAAAILFSGYQFILEKKYLQYGLIVLIASLFHKSAIVMVLPCFLFSRKPDLKQVILLAFGSIVLVLSYDTIFGIIGAVKGKTMVLEEGTYRTNDVNPLRILVSFVPVLIYIVLCDKEHHTKKQDFYINAVLFNAFAMLASMGSTYLARIGIYTNSLLILGYGSLLQLIRDEITKRVTVMCVLAMYFFFWIYSVQAAGISSFQFCF